MPPTNNPSTQDSTDPQVRWPKPPYATKPNPAQKAIAVFVIIIALLCFIMTFKMFEISNELKILNNTGKAGISSPATISRTP